jgi:hypothetical protein
MRRPPSIKSSRRRFLELTAGCAAASALLPTLSHAAELPHLSETDPAAQALGYHEDTRKVPSAKYPAHRVTQECGKCRFYQAAAGAQWGPCTIFPGKAVHVGGWCSAFSPKQ